MKNPIHGGFPGRRYENKTSRTIMSSVYNHVYGGVFVRVLLLYRFQTLANHIWSHQTCLNASTAAISLVPRPALPLVFDHALAICRNWRRGRPRVAAASG